MAASFFENDTVLHTERFIIFHIKTGLVSRVLLFEVTPAFYYCYFYYCLSLSRMFDNFFLLPFIMTVTSFVSKNQGEVRFIHAINLYFCNVKNGQRCGGVDNNTTDAINNPYITRSKTCCALRHGIADTFSFLLSIFSSLKKSHKRLTFYLISYIHSFKLSPIMPWYYKESEKS